MNQETKLGLFVLAGCQSTTPGNVGRLHSYPFPLVEAEWIHNGEPIEFEEALWFPADDVEVFLDSEMTQVGEYNGVAFFIDKFDMAEAHIVYALQIVGFIYSSTDTAD